MEYNFNFFFVYFLDIQCLTTQEKYRECSLLERSNENAQMSSNDENAQMSHNMQQRIVQVSLHEPAYLHCTIPHLKQNMVSHSFLI